MARQRHVGVASEVAIATSWQKIRITAEECWLEWGTVAPSILYLGKGGVEGEG